VGIRKNPNYLKVVAKTFHLVEAMSKARSGIRLSELARKLGQPKATVFRILYTLQELGYVQQDPGTEMYRLSERIGRFTHGDAREMIIGAARPLMGHLLSRFEQTVNLGMMEHDKVIYVEIKEGLRSIRMAATVNTYAPLHSTALGKSLLAFLDPHEAEAILKKGLLTRFTEKTITELPQMMSHLKQVRKQGFAVDNEEMEWGARCIAAPLRNAAGVPIAAISVSGSTSQVRGVQVKEIAQALVKGCREVSEQLGFSGRITPLTTEKAGPTTLKPRKLAREDPQDADALAS
jgi:DNA-binding IclR family transcriptional regulator